jgi:hypothetical protein
MDSTQFGDAVQVHNVLRFKELLAHRWNQVSAAGEHSNVSHVSGERVNGLVECPGPQ